MDILTLERLENLFFAQGYSKIPSNLPEFNFYCHREVQGLNVLYVIDYRQGLYISEDQYAHMKDRIADFFHVKGETEIHVMTLVLCVDTEKAKKLCEHEKFCWILDAQTWRRRSCRAEYAAPGPPRSGSGARPGRRAPRCRLLWPRR